ncbi:hypothetical protein OH77DRAFT_53353 [Trametes cingulata]|nr:hypothetical protein OH77DRAFT_53353 [Trametes cingulata]
MACGLLIQAAFVPYIGRPPCLRPPEPSDHCWRLCARSWEPVPFPRSRCTLESHASLRRCNGPPTSRPTTRYTLSRDEAQSRQDDSCAAMRLVNCRCCEMLLGSSRYTSKASAASTFLLQNSYGHHSACVGPWIFVTRATQKAPSSSRNFPQVERLPLHLLLARYLRSGGHRQSKAMIHLRMIRPRPLNAIGISSGRLWTH